MLKMIDRLTISCRAFAKRVRIFKSNLNLARTFKLIWSVEKKWTTYNLLMILVETGSFFFSLYALKLLIDGVSHSGFTLAIQKEILFSRLWFAGITSILYMVSRAISAFVIEKQSARVAAYLDDRIHESATKLDLSFYESPEYFDILKRARDAGSDRPALVIKTLSEILKNTLTIAAMAVILITIDWRLIPMLFILVFPLLLVKISFADKLNVWRVRQTPVERQANYLGELITSETAAKEIRSYRLGNYFRSLYLRIRLTLLSQQLALSLKRTQKEVLSGIIATAGFFACIGYITLKTLNGQTTVGDIALFLVIFPQSFSLIQNISGGASIVYQNNIFINSIFDLFNLKSKLPEPENAVSSDAIRSFNVELRDVGFTYPHCSTPVLSNINMEIPAGKVIGVAGLNGAGKTTLIKLLCRLYDVSDGGIYIGGTDIREFKIDDYRKQIGVVFQDFVKYNFSAKENIGLGAIDRNFESGKIKAAAIKSGADEFINRFPNGYESMMGRLFAEGNEVSIGQWQKLAIARAFYNEAPFLILDEATSALDAAAEKRLFNTFRESIGNRSALVISHRYSALRHADYIYVLDDGKIVQSGTNEELLAMEGLFARLFKEDALASNEIILI